MKRFLFQFLPMVAFVTGIVSSPVYAQRIPEIPREFRAAWVATVANIDWPSSKNLTTEEQKAEFITILDTAKEMHLNAIVFQIRPMADALYDSKLEPWSEFLTGTMGKRPDPYYDPLTFAVREAHQRGIELHVWFNPYRASHPSAKTELPKSHISRTHPEIVRQYGDYLWLDPAEELTKRHTLDVILDVVNRYDIDGVHLDDYFYPYTSYANGADFPDEKPWKRYLEDGGKMSRGDWRRDHVNDFVERLYKGVKEAKPLVKVGISPFGIWRPGFPESIEAGLDQYAVLYADARLWLNEGWVDYFTPQLYWPIDQIPQSYPVLLKWWTEENTQKRHIWPGNFTSKVTNSESSWPVSEIVNQIKLTRDQKGATGNVHFSMVAFLQNRKNMTDILTEGVYSSPALVPASPWLSESVPSVPRLRISTSVLRDTRTIAWESPEEEQVRLWVIYKRTRDNKWSYEFIPTSGRTRGSFSIPDGSDLIEIAVASVDRNGTMGPRAHRSL